MSAGGVSVPGSSDTRQGKDFGGRASASSGTAAKPQAGDIITLEGITLKGKNRVREHGEQWLIRSVDRSRLGRNLGLLVCPASYIGTPQLDPSYDRPNMLHQVDGYSRWVRRSLDPDFQILWATDG